MNLQEKIKIFLVDDDAVFLKSLEIEFLSEGDFVIETYPTGELCIKNISNMPDVVILDYHLNGIDPHAMNGLETLDKIKALHADMPVVILSSQDKIDVAIACMHHKAIDYIVKSETAFFRLQKTITTILQYKNLENKLNWYKERM
jgi:DNA-binding NtrC family response regulator